MLSQPNLPDCNLHRLFRMRRKSKSCLKLLLNVKLFSGDKLRHHSVPRHVLDRPDDDRHGHQRRRLGRTHQLRQEEERVRGSRTGNWFELQFFSSVDLVPRFSALSYLRTPKSKSVSKLSSFHLIGGISCSPCNL